jgi:D-sedoheptulose 7-phosphate isomerase
MRPYSLDFRHMASSIEHIEQHLNVVQSLKNISPAIDQAFQLIQASLSAGGKILICGNGGSASDAQHFAAELVGRFETTRPGLAALSLNTDTSNLTAIANDFGFEHVFSRQVEAIGKAEDCLVALSTSGNSKNVLQAVASANAMGMKTIGLLGNNGGQLLQSCHHSVVVPSASTARIQECHILIIHILCALVDQRFTP